MLKNAFHSKEMRAVKPLASYTEWITEKHIAFQEILDLGG